MESSSLGTTTLTTIIHHPVEEQVINVLNIAEPNARLPLTRIEQLAPELLATTTELSATNPTSELFT